MTTNDLLEALARLRVETGSLACLGCGHEHNCSTHGCAILRAAADLIERLSAENAKAEAERDALREKQRWIPVTERLPDERDAVIILLKDGQVFRGEIRERIALPEWWYFYDASDTDMDMLGVMYPLFDDGLWLHENPVVAWMPLPEALEEALEEGEKA